MRRLIPILLLLVLSAGAGVAGGLSIAGAAPNNSVRLASCFAEQVEHGAGQLITYAHPTSISLDCTSTSEFTLLTGLSWQSWGQPDATATGNLTYNRCTPGLLCNTPLTYAATVTIEVSNIQSVGHLQLYQDLVFIAPAGYDGETQWWLYPSNVQVTPGGAIT